LCSSDCSVQVSALCNTGVAMKVKEYYERFVNSSNIMAVFLSTAGHTFVRFVQSHGCVVAQHNVD